MPALDAMDFFARRNDPPPGAVFSTAIRNGRVLPQCLGTEGVFTSFIFGDNNIAIL
jgi:hypothetical protein